MFWPIWVPVPKAVASMVSYLLPANPGWIDNSTIPRTTRLLKTFDLSICEVVGIRVSSRCVGRLLGRASTKLYIRMSGCGISKSTSRRSLRCICASGRVLRTMLRYSTFMGGACVMRRLNSPHCGFVHPKMGKKISVGVRAWRYGIAR